MLSIDILEGSVHAYVLDLKKQRSQIEIDELVKKLKAEMLLSFAKLQGYVDDQLKRLEDILARAKDMDEAISEFRRLKDEGANDNGNGIGKHVIVKDEPELLKRLDEGWNLVQNLNGGKFLLEKP